MRIPECEIDFHRGVCTIPLPPGGRQWCAPPGSGLARQQRLRASPITPGDGHCGLGGREAGLRRLPTGARDGRFVPDGSPRLVGRLVLTAAPVRHTLVLFVS
ncbi:MAG: hypothetical protein OHK0015_13450 [Chloroflexi bacterium OHK40]